MWRRKAGCTGKELVMPLLKPTGKENLNFIKKKEELEENLIYRFEQIRSTELKNNNIGVSQCKILIAYFSRCPKLRTGHFA